MSPQLLGRAKLTNQQFRVLRYIVCYLIQNSFAPTLQEITTHMKFESKNGAKLHVTALKKAGYLKNGGKNVARGLVVPEFHAEMAAIGKKYFELLDSRMELV